CESRHHAVELLSNLVGVGTRANHVVAARTQTNEVGAQLHRSVELLIHDLLNELAAHCQVCVCEIGVVSRQLLCKTVSPAAKPTRTIGIRIAEALGER